MSTQSYVIGSGWWCSDRNERVAGRPYYGTDIIRGAEFHYLWSALVDAWTAPEEVFIVDSASPVKPPIYNPIYKRLELSKNLGHATVHIGYYSGWMASVLLSIEYALLADVEYLVYVEQDVLLYGEGILEHCISKMKRPLMFGSGDGTPQPLQQSLFIIRRDGMRRFLSGLHAITATDQVVTPEWKFLLSSVGLTGRVAQSIFRDVKTRGRIFRVFGSLLQSLGYDILPIGHGRSRPIDMRRQFFYFQQGEIEELQTFAKLIPDSIFQIAASKSLAIANLRSN